MQLAATLLLLASLFSRSYLSATVMIQIVTPDGIVLAADSKAVDNAGKDLGATTKIVLLPSKVAVASCDLSVIHDAVTDTRSLPARTHRYNYDFQSWLKALPDTRYPKEMTNIIMEDIPKTFADYGFLIISKELPERRLLVEYYVAGYTKESGPVINKITVPLDWSNAAVLPPRLDVVHPLPGADPNFGFNAGCGHDAVNNVMKREGKPYDRARELEPLLLDKLLSKKDLTIKEAKRMATALVIVESEFSPAMVGLPVQIVVIDKPSTSPR